jgi:hypothetical protein
LIIFIIMVTMLIDFPSFHFFVFHTHIYWSLKTKVWCDIFSKALKMVQPRQFCWKNEVNKPKKRNNNTITQKLLKLKFHNQIPSLSLPKKSSATSKLTKILTIFGLFLKPPWLKGHWPKQKYKYYIQAKKYLILSNFAWIVHEKILDIKRSPTMKVKTNNPFTSSSHLCRSVILKMKMLREAWFDLWKRMSFK